MKAARIAVFENNLSTQHLIEVTLHGTDHQIVAYAATREKGLELVAQAGQEGSPAGFDVALLDGNLEGSIAKDGADGRALHDVIRPMGAYIIGISADSLPFDYGIPIPPHHDIGKHGIVAKLVDVLESLPEIEAS